MRASSKDERQVLLVDCPDVESANMPPATASTPPADKRPSLVKVILRRVSSSLTLADGDDERSSEMECLCQGINKESIIKVVKYSYSLCLLTFCVYIILSGIFAAQTPVSSSIHWSVAFVTMWILILWLGMLEGGQGCLVGLQPIDKESYQQSHPITHKCAALAHQGDNLKRFIVGRQFLVVMVVFGLNLCCGVIQDAVIPGFSPGIVEVFLGSGLAVLLITVILGQLSAEVNATECMLDFINTPVMFATTWLCLAIESSGLMHCLYLLDTLGAKKSSPTNDSQSQTVKTKVFFWARVVVSLSFLSFACIVTMSALLNGQTTMCEGLPNVVSVSIFGGLVCFLGMMEAMQIALFAVVNLDRSELDKYPTARANCDVAFEGTNFQAFLIGRQICVTNAMFLLARVTTTEVDLGEVTVMGISPGLQAFFNCGLPGAFIVTIVASLAWRIFASSYPIYFLSNPLVKATIRMCLLLETSGLFSATWLLATAVKRCVGLQLDEDYLGPLQGYHSAGKEEKEKQLELEVEDDSTASLSQCSTFSDYGSTCSGSCSATSAALCAACAKTTGSRAV